MGSIIDLLTAITLNLNVDDATRTRAGFLLVRLNGGAA
jgi:hypothetical protein